MYRVSQKKVSDKIFPRRLPNGRGLRTNFQLNCEASLKTWSFPQKSSRQTSGKRPGVRRQSLQLVRSPRPLGSRQGKISSETFFWDTLYIPGLVPIESCCKVLLPAPSATFNEMEEFHHIMKMRRHHKPWLWNTSPRPMSANHNNYMLNEKTNIHSRLGYDW